MERIFQALFGAGGDPNSVAKLYLSEGYSLRLTREALIEEQGGSQLQRHRLAGLVAKVEEGGTVNRRFTVTRIATLGVLAAGVPKRIDDRELFLTIEGPETVIVRAIPVKGHAAITATAREFVAKVNQASGAASVAQGPSWQDSVRANLARHASAPAAPSPTTPDDDSDVTVTKIRQLAKLREEGLITAEEFDAKKADLLERY
ncbi:hypothetical protein HDC37_001328 [Microbacterium sp. AK009]|uniref:SHOCT domain-containing protein n=1 Tax=Microbacterium sp. AK009 TaxID=2723068 RepID=UPI0015CCE2F7|nr:SHOCT domain-containing protein [Microbacterium sp. AK009]NYF16503.1 hypothetical protein [Microbacterium sp. AK009]